MAEPLVAQLAGRAVLAHAERRFTDARRHYGQVAERLRRNGSMHTPFHELAMLTVAFSEGDLSAAEPLARELHDMTGPLAADAWAVTLAAAGRLDEARAAFGARRPIRRDFFHSLFATWRAMAAISLDARAEAKQLVRT
jgi:hypothetical protein